MLVRSARISLSLVAAFTIAACSDAPLGGIERGSSGRTYDSSPSSAADPTSPAPAATATSGASPPAAPAAAAPAPPAPPAPVPAKLLLAPMHMHYPFDAVRGDWIMSLLAGESAPVYTYTGVQYKVLAVAPTDGRAVLSLYRCIDRNGTHFQSNLATCEGAGTLEGRLGFVFAEDPGGGARVILRCIGAPGFPIVSTLDRPDCIGFIEQPITLGWAFSRDANP